MGKAASFELRRGHRIYGRHERRGAVGAVVVLKERRVAGHNVDSADISKHRKEEEVLRELGTIYGIEVAL